MNPYFISAIVICIYMIVWFLLAQAIKDNSIVDIAWGGGFVILAWILYWLFDTAASYFFIVIVTTLWGVRLASYLFVRNTKVKGEDWRYVKMRNSWGNPKWLHALVKVFLFQGVMMWLIALPLMAVGNADIMELNWLQYIGLGLALVGWLWESVADWQLYQFKKDKMNKGKIMRSGVWAYSRHPNYFGEIVFWWGLFLATVPHGYWWISILSPITITFLLVRVSGVPMLEHKYKDNPVYQTYVKETNALIPKLL